LIGARGLRLDFTELSLARSVGVEDTAADEEDQVGDDENPMGKHVSGEIPEEMTSVFWVY